MAPLRHLRLHAPFHQSWIPDDTMETATHPASTLKVVPCPPAAIARKAANLLSNFTDYAPSHRIHRDPHGMHTAYPPMCTDIPTPRSRPH